jgi:glucosamine-6-phosphate deaminase
MRVYQELVRLHREEGLSFAGVTAFNLDEYYPMQPTALQSYHRFMHEHLFGAVDIDPARVHIPDGTGDPADLARQALVLLDGDSENREHYARVKAFTLFL